MIRSWRSEQNIEKVQHVRHACNNSLVLMYPMLCNCICMTKYIRIIKKQNICEVTFNLSIAVKVTILLFLCGLLNCIRADLFMNNALYKCCIITHHSLRCIAQRSGKKNGTIKPTR